MSWLSEISPAIGIPLLFVASVVALLLYLLPSFVAVKREHENQMGVVALNFFAGWTLIGWIACLVWAMRD